MYVIIWEFQTGPGYEDPFERAYGPQGEWAALFRRGEGYQGTELLRDMNNPRRYMTIDRWQSREAYEAFQRQWSDEYQALDQQCAALTEHEALAGSMTLVAG